MASHRVNITVSYELTDVNGSKMSEGSNSWVDVPYEGAVQIEGYLVELLAKTVEMGKKQSGSSTSKAP